jgi:hypothetical protein
LRLVADVLFPKVRKNDGEFRDRLGPKNLYELKISFFPLQALEIPQNRQRNPWIFQAFPCQKQEKTCQRLDGQYAKAA